MSSATRCSYPQDYRGSFYNVLKSIAVKSSATGDRDRVICDALTLVQAIVSVFPQFKDEHIHPKTGKGKEDSPFVRHASFRYTRKLILDLVSPSFTVFLWKRPQILVAELWAAMASVSDDVRYPQISGIERLTMFAD